MNEPTVQAGVAGNEVAEAIQAAPVTRRHHTFPAANLRIVRVIAHQVFSPDDKGDPVAPLLSTKLTSVTDAATKLLSDRISDALGKRSYSFPITFRKTDAESFYAKASLAIQAQSDQDFIDASRDIAQILADSQRRRDIPDGVLIVVQARLRKRTPVLLVFKCEKQAGFAGVVDKNNDTMIQVVTDLLLTPAGKLYKVCALIDNGAGGHDSFLFDGGVTRKKEIRVVQYFAETFLGAQLAADGRVETYGFYQASLAAINNLNVPTAQKVDLRAQLGQFLATPEAADGEAVQMAFTADEFVQQHVPASHQDAFRQTLTAHGVPQRAIVKDTVDLKGKLKTSAIDFDNGLKLIGPPEMLGDVSVQEEGDGFLILRIGTGTPIVR